MYWLIDWCFRSGVALAWTTSHLVNEKWQQKRNTLKTSPPMNLSEISCVVIITTIIIGRRLGLDNLSFSKRQRTNKYKRLLSSLSNHSALSGWASPWPGRPRRRRTWCGGWWPWPTTARPAMYVYIYIYIYTHHTLVYVYIYIYIYIDIYVYIYIYIYTTILLLSLVVVLLSLLLLLVLVLSWSLLLVVVVVVVAVLSLVLSILLSL